MGEKSRHRHSIPFPQWGVGPTSPILLLVLLFFCFDLVAPLTPGQDSVWSYSQQGRDWIDSHCKGKSIRQSPLELPHLSSLMHHAALKLPPDYHANESGYGIEWYGFEMFEYNYDEGESPGGEGGSSGYVVGQHDHGCFGQTGLSIEPSNKEYGFGTLWHRGNAYKAVDVHVHGPAEHTMEDSMFRYPLELHIVHRKISNPLTSLGHVGHGYHQEHHHVHMEWTEHYHQPIDERYQDIYNTPDRNVYNIPSHPPSAHKEAEAGEARHARGSASHQRLEDGGGEAHLITSFDVVNDDTDKGEEDDTVGSSHYKTETDSDILVLGLFVAEGYFNSFLHNFTLAVGGEMHLQRHSMKFVPHTTLSLRQLLGDGPLLAYSYAGSLTTPPCTETAHWLVVGTPFQAEPRQLHHIRSLMGVDMGTGTWRHTQNAYNLHPAKLRPAAGERRDPRGHAQYSYELDSHPTQPHTHS